MTLTEAQSRAARGILDWSQADLARQSNLSESTIRDFEKGRRMPGVNNLAAIQRAFEDAGVVFIEQNGGGPGVRRRLPDPPFTMKEFNDVIDEFERERFESIRAALTEPRIAKNLSIERRADGIALVVKRAVSPIGTIQLSSDGLKFVPELENGRDWTSHHWLTLNELSRWIQEAWASQVRR